MLRDQVRRRQGDTGTPELSLPPPCEIGLVFPSAAEAAGVRDRLQDPLTLQAKPFDMEETRRMFQEANERYQRGG